MPAEGDRDVPLAAHPSPCQDEPGVPGGQSAESRAGGLGSLIKRVIDFGSERDGQWFVVNDDVMGGRSSSVLTSGSESVAAFEGTLSLENNGGFASVRIRIPEGGLVGASRIWLRVRGDGRRYELRLHPDPRFAGFSFGASFKTTAGQWTTFELPLRAFEPTFRGNRPHDAGPLRPAQVGQIGVMLKDKQEGPFRLEIDWLAIDRQGVAS